MSTKMGMPDGVASVKCQTNTGQLILNIYMYPFSTNQYTMCALTVFHVCFSPHFYYFIRVIDKNELRSLLEDISEAKAGHRTVDDSIVQEILERLDQNKDGVVQKEEFKALCSSSGVGAYYI